MSQLLIFCCLSLFSYIVAQTPPQLPNPCDCIRVPGSTQCLKYDNRLQAHSLDEAMGFFEDLSLLGESKPAEKLNRDASPQCQTKECRVCRKMLAKKLKTVGLLQSIIFEATGQNVTTRNLTESCSKYRFARANSDTINYGDLTGSNEKDNDESSSSSEEIDEIKESIKNEIKSKTDDLKSLFGSFFGRKKRDAIELVEKPKNSIESVESIEAVEEELERNKRAALPSDPDFIGTRFYLSCTEKGTSLDGSGLLSLCTKCWAWRELPENYYPRYVNELVCHSNDTSCLSGYATCGSGTQQLDVLRNDSGTLVAITLAASTYCECQIKAGTTLEPLVFGDAFTSALPGIPPANDAAVV